MIQAMTVSNFLGYVDVIGLCATYARHYSGFPVTERQHPGLPLPAVQVSPLVNYPWWVRLANGRFGTQAVQIHQGLMHRGLSQIFFDHAQRAYNPNATNNELNRVVATAGRALIEMGPESLTNVVGRLGSRVHRLNPVTVANAHLFGDEAVPVLERQINARPGHENVGSAISILTRINTDNSRAALIRLLNSENEEVAYAVAGYFVAETRLSQADTPGFYEKVWQLYGKKIEGQLYRGYGVAEPQLKLYQNLGQSDAIKAIQAATLVKIASDPCVSDHLREAALVYLFERRYFSFPQLFAATQLMVVVRLAALAYFSDNRTLGYIANPDANTWFLLGGNYAEIVSQRNIRVRSGLKNFHNNVELFLAWEMLGYRDPRVIALAERLLERGQVTYSDVITIADTLIEGEGRRWVS